LIETGVAGTGPFATNSFKTGTLENKTSVAAQLSFNTTDKSLSYNKAAIP
jgi:hypothetical protein